MTVAKVAMRWARYYATGEPDHYWAAYWASRMWVGGKKQGAPLRREGK